MDADRASDFTPNNNLYSITVNQTVIIALFRVMKRSRANRHAKDCFPVSFGFENLRPCNWLTDEASWWRS
jgi:hypothetical protein